MIIPPAHWREFLDSFTRVHRGWLVSVDSPNEPGMLMRDVPLASILLDDGNIVIGTARDREHTDHVVPKTRRLIEERGFAAVAVEADWPDAYSRALGARTAVRDGGDG